MFDTLSECAPSTQARDFIICGWFTPDYRHWWDRLRKSLEAIGAPHDFVEREKVDSGWEANTMRKPHEILAAMDRHPDTTIIFLDVDCTIAGTYADLVELAAIPGDVGFRVRTGQRRRAQKPFCRVRSGTVVIRPTNRARAFIEAWRKAGAEMHRYSVDQDTMLLALGRVPGLTITCIDNRFCVAPRDAAVPNPVIVHDWASKDSHAGKWAQRFYQIKRYLLPYAA